MNRFSMWFANMMRGRYGVDQLNRFLFILTLVLIVIDMFARTRILHFLTVILLIYTYSRMFSRNIRARSAENQKFLQITSRFRGNRGGYGNNVGRQGGISGFWKKKDPAHRILRCPGCGEKLRVPRNAGTIRIKCPHCGEQFTKKV